MAYSPACHRGNWDVLAQFRRALMSFIFKFHTCPKRLSLVSFYHSFRNIRGQLDGLIDCFINIRVYMQTSSQTSNVFILLFPFINDSLMWLLKCSHIRTLSSLLYLLLWDYSLIHLDLRSRFPGCFCLRAADGLVVYICQHVHKLSGSSEAVSPHPSKATDMSGFPQSACPSSFHFSATIL